MKVWLAWESYKYRKRMDTLVGVYRYKKDAKKALEDIIKTKVDGRKPVWKDDMCSFHSDDVDYRYSLDRTAMN